MPAATPAAPEKTRNRRCVSSGLVARFSLTLIRYSASIPFRSRLTAVQHPADQTFEFAVRQRPSIIRNSPVRDCAVKQRTHLAVKFILKRTHKFREPTAESGNTHGLNAFAPSVLIIGRYGINFLQQHIGR